MPEGDEEGVEEAAEQAKKANEEINKFNDAVNKMKTFVKLNGPMEDEPATLDYESFDEKCFIRLQNYREPPVVEVDIAAEEEKKSVKASQEKKSGEMKAEAKANESQGELKGESISETASQKETRQITEF